MSCRFRFFFDPGSGVCLWADNDAAREWFGYAVTLDALPLTAATRAMGEELIARFDTSLDWNDPLGPTPWTARDEEEFETAAQALLARLREELGESFVLVDEH